MKKTRLFLRRFLALTICLVMFFTMGVSLNADKLSAYAMAENSSSKSDENVEVYFEKSDGKIVKPDSNGKFTLTSIETVFPAHLILNARPKKRKALIDGPMFG